MSHQVIWTKLIVETFVSEGNLTKEEEMVLRTRAAGWTRTKQMNEFCMSAATLDRIISRLKKKYDACQKYSTILPVRKSSAAELYMDEN